jgi:hypothetical protein
MSPVDKMEVSNRLENLANTAVVPTSDPDRVRSRVAELSGFRVRYEERGPLVYVITIEQAA